MLWEPEKEDDYGYLWCLPFVIKSVLNLRFIDWALKTWSNTNKMFEKGMIHAFPYGSYVAFGMSHVAHTDRDGLNKSTFEAGPWTREGILRLTDCIWGIHTLGIRGIHAHTHRERNTVINIQNLGAVIGTFAIYHCIASCGYLIVLMIV